MKKSTRNFIMFILLLFTGLIEAISGFVLWLMLPGGQGYQDNQSITAIARSTVIWGRHTWIDIHDWFAVVIVVLVVIHLVLHWKWIFYSAKKQLSFTKPISSETYTSITL